jgi:hypothetical protein
MEGRSLALHFIQVIRKNVEWSMDSNNRMNGDLSLKDLEASIWD